MASVPKNLLLIFVAIMLLVCAELAWWITFNLRTVHKERQAVVSLYRQQAQWLNQSRAPEWPAVYPHLYLDTQGAVQVRPEALLTLDDRKSRLLRMFIAEGAFFLVMVGIGGLLIFRTLQREVLLVRQENNFLAAVTHELKSPLAALQLATETMQLRELSADRRQTYLKEMHQDIERLNQLTNDLLTAARLESVAEDVVHAPLEIIGASRDIVQSWCQRHPFKVDFAAGVAYAWTRLDMESLHSILYNLLDNAVKYAAGSGMQVDLTTHKNCLQLRVRDAGAGIPAAEHRRVFNKFVRLGNELTREQRGSGLGLYIVARLAQQHGGRAYCEDLPLGCNIVVEVPTVHAPVSG